MALPPFVAAVVTTTANRSSAWRAVQSLGHHHPHAVAIVVFVDDRFGAAMSRLPATAIEVDVRGPAWLAAVLGPELRRLAMIHVGEALCRAVRPFALRALFEELGPHVLLSLPADAEVFGPIDELLRVDAGQSIAVVPSRLGAPPPDGRLPDAVDLAAGGRFDQELFAVAERGPLDAWGALLVRSPHIDPDRVPEGHPWFDDVVAAADPRGVRIVRDHRIGVTYRNADEPGREGDPRIICFEGFDPQRPWLLSERTGALPRVLLSRHPWLARRCEARAAALGDLRADDLHTDDLGLLSGWSSLANGLAIDEAMRRAYRRGVLDHLSDETHLEPPNPFDDSGTAAFVLWLGASTDERRPASRYLRALHEARPDLRARFVDPDDPGPEGLRAWARINGRSEGIPPELIPTPDAGRLPALVGEPAVPPPNGLNVIGFLHGELGVGEAARQLLRGVEASGVPSLAIADRATLHRQRAELDTQTTEQPVHRLNLVALNPDALANFAQARGAEFFRGRRTIGLWFWEVEGFPVRFLESFDLVDEVWVATEHVRAAIAAATDKPVRVIPLPLPAFASAAGSATRDRAHFRVLFSFDYASVAERKNPVGAYRAYRAAFPTPDEVLPDGRTPRLILKSINGDRHGTDREQLLAAIVGQPDVALMEDYLEELSNRALVAGVDCYLSLHRAEGWGLTMAEAMAAGVPVVATGYSGNRAFMDETNSWLVPFNLVPIPAFVREYAGCGRWAEPDQEAAAAALRSIALDPAAAQERADRGRLDVRRLADPTPAGEFIRIHTTAIVTADLAVALPVPLNRVPKEAPVAPVPPPSSTDQPTDLIPATTVLDHPGLGPVILPPPPGAAPSPAGLKGSVRGRVERAIKFEVDHRDQREHAQAVALVEELSLTREAVRAVATHQLADQDALTATLSGATDHLRALQFAHDSLHTAVEQIGTSAHDSTVALGDLSTRLSRIEARLDQLTSALEALAAQATQAAPASPPSPPTPARPAPAGPAPAGPATGSPPRRSG